MKIIDSFIFYNEIDLLSYRLDILDPYVDYFIIVESTYTFTGHSKPLYYQDNKSKYEKFHHKIIHIIVDDIPHKYPAINYQLNHQWDNEYHQRNAIKKGLDQIIDSLCDTDIILTSDVDEIPNPMIVEQAKNGTLSYDKISLNRLSLDMYYYNLRCRVGGGSNWHGIKLLSVSAYRNIQLTFQQMRVHEHSHYVPVIPHGGWHLSYFGDISFIIKKINSFSHQEYNNDSYLNEEKLKHNMEHHINLLNQSELVYIPIELNTNLPYQYDIYLKMYI